MSDAPKRIWVSADESDKEYGTLEVGDAVFFDTVFDGSEDLVEYIRADLAAPKVKELVWDEECDFHSHETFVAECFYGTYWAYDPIEERAGYYFELDELATVVSTGPYDSMDAAKAAAQADYEQRILSALK